jgi:hypothetical protein
MSSCRGRWRICRSGAALGKTICPNAPAAACSTAAINTAKRAVAVQIAERRAPRVAADEVVSQCRQPIISTLRPPVFDREVVPLDIIDFLETLVETGHEVRRLIEGLLLRNPITGALPVTPAASFNHLIGTAEQFERESQAEGPRGLHVEHQLCFYGLLHRQIGGPVAFEDAPRPFSADNSSGS